MNNQTTIVTVASYYGSGSSAVTDYVSEFDNVKSLTSYEFRFIQDPDGVSELEYNLVENFNRHNSGHALKRYKKLVDYYGKHLFVKRYENYFDNKWKEISYEYIENLTDFKYPGLWQYDFYDKGAWYEFWHKFPDRLLHKTVWKNKVDKHFFFDKGITYASHPTEERFLQCTREYTRKLMSVANKENCPIMIVDQLLPSTNIERHMRYFDNIRAFVVERDPRDIFLLAKYVWHDLVIPHDVELFCKWFLYTRSTRKTEIWNPEKIMLIQFEDLIYKYDETTAKIRAWLGLNEEEHMNPYKYLDPNKSINNTRLWEKNTSYIEEATYIKNRLSEYIYEIK